MMLLLIRDLGLVAFMQMNGCRLMKFEAGSFAVETEDLRTLDEWSVEYTNSCCSAHDQGILVLRNMVRGSRNEHQEEHA